MLDKATVKSNKRKRMYFAAIRIPFGHEMLEEITVDTF